MLIRHLLWVVLCFPQKIHEVLSPGASGSDLIRKETLDRGNQVKIRPFEWVLIHYDWCPYKQERSGDRCVHREDATWRWRQSWVMVLQTRLPPNHQKLGRSHEEILPHGSQKKTTLWTPKPQTSSLQNWDKKISVAEATQFVLLCYNWPSKQI